jgi:hypothetical protein
MKLVFSFLVLFLSQITLAEARTKLCQYYYKHDIFSGYLELSLEKTQNGRMTLWMETPTPYGIRPYTYDVSTMSCNLEKSLHIEAKSSGTTQTVVFNSKNSNQAGKLEYLNDKNETSVELIMECSPEKIQELCL